MGYACDILHYEVCSLHKRSSTLNLIFFYNSGPFLPQSSCENYEAENLFCLLVPFCSENEHVYSIRIFWDSLPTYQPRHIWRLEKSVQRTMEITAGKEENILLYIK